MDLYRKNIHYLADTYEVYESGRMLDSGVCNVEIRGIVKQSEIKFILTGVESFPLASVFSFPFSTPEAELLPDRIAYFKTYVPDGNEPMVCHLFLKGYDLDFIRFAIMGRNGFKLFEFKGRLLEEENVEDISLSVQSAESIISELKRTDSLTAERLLEWGADLYNANSDVATADGIRAILEAFKLFIEAFKLEREKMGYDDEDRDYWRDEEDEDFEDEEDEDEDEDYNEEDEDENDRFSFAMPVILKFIALCNYKLDHLTQAGKVAERGLEELERAQQNSFISFDPDSLGKNTLEEIIRLVRESGQYEPLDYDDDSFDETEMDFDEAEGLLLFMENDDSRAEELSPENFKDLLKRIRFAGNQIWKLQKGSESSIMLFQLLDIINNTLYYCWEKLGFGHHSDFWKEGDSMMTYMFIELDPRPKIEQLISTFNTHNPFGIIDRKSIIKKGVIVFCSETLKHL